MSNPITPPPELLQEWYNDKTDYFTDMILAAQWGADMELEACCNLLTKQGFDVVDDLLAARRPKPPSLKELALEALDQADKGLNKSEWQQCSDTIRRALESIND
jgi:hypothetical protein